MGIQIKCWQFYSPSKPEEIITVHDPASARLVADLIEKAHPNQTWMMVGEPIDHLIPSPLPATPIPVPVTMVRNEVRNEVQQQPKAERRVHPRFPIEFRVIMINGGHCFRTATKDISLGGVRLKNKIPDAFRDGKCILYLGYTGKKENIEVSCSVVSDENDAFRVRFQQSDEKQIQLLNQWIQELSAQKNAA